MDVGARTLYGEFVRDVGTAGDTSYFVKTPGAVRRLNAAGAPTDGTLFLPDGRHTAYVVCATIVLRLVPR